MYPLAESLSKITVSENTSCDSEVDSKRRKEKEEFCPITELNFLWVVAIVS